MERTNFIGTNKVSYPHAVVADIDGTLNIFPSDKIQRSGGRDIVLEDVDIQITDNGILHIIAQQVDFEYFYHGDGPLFYDELKAKNKYVLHDDRIIPIPTSKWKRFWSYKKETYKAGWIELKERKSFTVSTSNYRITMI